MVAVISGNGLGLLGTSASALGLGSQGGLGQSGASQYVNVATGNLVLQNRDEQLVAQGLLAGLTRTYNSLGSTGDVGAGAWLLGLDRRLGALSGTLNTAGSTITRDGGDGEEEIFTYDATRGLYVGTTKSGAEDTLAWSAGSGTWTYTGGGDRMQETYSAAGVLTDLTDGKSGAHYHLGYDTTTQALVSVTADDGEALVLGYMNGQINSLSSLEVPPGGGTAVTMQRVTYGYDSLGRLSTVTTDLTPDNTTDASTFSTTYTYDGDSLRVASLTQSDGVAVSYTYAQDSQGVYRIASVTTGSGAAAQTLSFSYDLTNHATTVTDASGRAWTYGYDANGNLSSVTSPAVNGQRQVTSYTYTPDGHLASMTDALGQTTIYRYDDRGNRILERDAAGNTVTSTYSADDQLLTRTVYRTPDPNGTDAGDTGAPADPSTTRYVYDSQDRLRFVIDADGDVQETQYNAQGLVSLTRGFAAAAYDVTGLAVDAAPDLATMSNWAAAQNLTRTTRTDYTYDTLTGRLTQHIVWGQVDSAGNGVADLGESITRYSYDGQGLLRQQITVRGSGRTTLESVSYAYDGLGRLQTRTDDVNHAVTSYSYQDGQGTVAVSYANGRVHTEVRNSAGELVTVTESATGATTRTTQYVYDADGQLRAVQDAGGGIGYTFYDAAGRVSGTVDDIGAVTRYVRDADGAVVETVQYATRVDTTGWLSNGVVGPSDLASILPATNAADRTMLSLHDGAGQHVADVDALGNVTVYGYDGAGNRVSSTAYATPLSAAQLSALQTTPSLATLLADVVTSAQDRTAYVLYDLANRPVATLDAQGYVTTTTYDAAGRVVKTTAYATGLTAAQRSALGHPPSLAALLADVVTGAGDQVTRFYYDTRGDLVAQVDADGYLTTTTYDEANDSVTTSRYSKALTVSQLSALTGQEAMATLVADVVGSTIQTAVTQYDAEGRVQQATAVDGTVTAYSYDSVGHLLSTTTTPPNGGQVRTSSATYDAFGDVATATDGALAKSTYQYNARGQETLRTDALGNTVWSYYDAAGRLTYQVAGQPNGGTLNAWGEVTAYTYNAFGQVATSRQLAGRATLTGGSSSGSTVNPDTATLTTLATASTALANPAKDAIQTYQYTLDGQVASVVDGNGYQVSSTYDAFGEMVRYVAGNGSISTYSYDARGERTGEIDNVGGLNRTISVAYDAFGRVTSRTDARGSVTSYTYDPLGRRLTQSQAVQGVVRTTQATYDAYGRVLTQTDAMGQVTAYQYSADTHTIQVTTPDGVTITKVTDAYGDTLSVTDGAGNVTSYTYDGDGRELTRTDALGQVSTNQYDADGHLLKTTDASGHVVSYAYDASGRVLTRTADPTGLNQVTTYTYDGRGQTLSVTDPRGAVTTYAYDADGNVMTMVEDAGSGHLNLTTTYTWDGAGHELSVTEGAGTSAARTMQYVYDGLGRRIRTVVDPGTGTNPNTNVAYLNLTTVFAYDGNGNLVTVTDPKGNVTRNVYDEANERIYTIDPAGGVVQAFYDADGRVTATRTYATPISLSGLSTAPTLADVAARVVADATIDQRRYTVYDAAGRVHYTVDPLGYITEQRYDAAGRPSETLTYAHAVSNQAFNNANLFPAMVAGTADSSMASLISAAGNTDANAEVTLSLYDADGEVRFVVQQNTVNGQLVAQVSERRYDAAGRVLSTIAYGTTIPLSSASALSAQLSTSSVAQTLASSTNYHQTRYVYDQAGRLRYTIDAGRFVTEQQYSTTGPRTETQLTYLNAITVPGTLTEASVASAVSATNTTATTRYTRNVYDLAGRLTSVVDALGTKASYTYDATGLKRTETNRDGAVWTYQYDAAGRQTRQISPAVTVATYTTGNTLSTTSASVITALTYDANGNVKTRTDGYGTAAARTITYTYDSRNHQTTTTYPDPGYVDGSGVFHATSATGITTATVTYDGLGHAVVSKDVRGHYAYKAYNLDGELGYDVDANGYVTAYSYDAYGNQTGVTRYATALSGTLITAGQPLSVAQIAAALTTSGSDRTIITTYDQTNRKTSVVQSSISYVLAMGNSAGQGATAAPTTTYAYDAYGNVVKTSILIQGSYGTVGQSGYSAEVWATTYSYYNALNEKVMDVDPMGYVTTWAYNGAGQVSSTTEYANAIATGSLTTTNLPGLPATGTVAGGYDRTTTLSYDSIGRKTQQVQSGEYSYVNGTAGIAAGSSTTSIGYDGEDRVTSLTVNGATTTTTYDALGRVLTVTEPTRAVLASNWQATLAGNASIDLSTASLYVQAAPVTTITYDALGNAVRTVRSGAGATAETTYDHYDLLGRQVTEVDANGHATYSAYDQAGNRTSAWYTLTGNSGSTVVTATSAYDAANQRLSAVTTRTGVSTPDRAEYVKYNAFGEVTARGDGVVNAYSSDGYEAVFAYNNAGQQTSAPDSGTSAIHSYGYDLAGHLTFDGSTVTGGGSTTWAHYWLDLDGRATQFRLPAGNASSGVDTNTQTTRTYDRWGNVLSQTDARGYVTTYLYDSQNHVIKETEPQVLVVGANGARTWQVPVKQWFYDVNGRLMGVTDENNHSSWNTYDAAGQLTVSQDALGAKTYVAYDVLGRALAKQTPPVQTGTATLVHITTTTYDLNDQITGQGDYTLDTSGSTRTAHTLQTFTLNENGDRRLVSDALGNTSYYDYDSQGRVLKSQTAVQHTNGVADTMVYDVNGNKIGQTDANGLTQSWVYDYFGRVQAHTDLNGSSYTYTYDSYSGLLTQQTSTWAPTGQINPSYMPSVAIGSGSTISYQYYANGKLQQITQKTGSQITSWTVYQYDASGNTIDTNTVSTDGAGNQIHTDTTVRYDSHGRIGVVTQSNPDTGTGLLRTAYNYDAVGNRRAVFVQSGFGTNASPINTGSGGPTVASISTQIAQPGQSWSFDSASAFTDTLGFGLTFTATGLPSWMHLSTDGVLSGTPGPDGSWSVTLTATDVTGASVTTTFTVTVPVVAPVFGGGVAPPTARIGTALSFAAPAATDANGATVTYSAQYYNGSSWTALPSWLSFNATTRTFSGTPPVGSIGNYALRVVASASNGGSAATGFTLTVASTPPVYQGGLTAQTADATRAFSYTAPPSAFYENDQTTLTYAAGGMPSWMSFNASTHVFSGTPPTSAIGYSNTITVTATNPQGQSASGSFTVSVEAYVQPAPVYNGGYTNQTGVIGGSSITIAKPTNAFTEPDGGALTYSAMVLIPQHDLDYPVNGGTDVATRTIAAQWVAISQVGLSINATTGAITGVPTTLDYLISQVTNTYENDSGYQLEVIATNGQGGTVAAQFTLSNTFAAPAVLNAIATPSAANPNTGAIQLVQSNTFSDPYGAGLTYSASGLPSGMSWSGSSLIIGQVAAGSYPITVTAHDGLGRTVSANVTISVNNVAPGFAGGLSNLSVNSGIAMPAYQAPAATDANGDAITYSATGLPPGVSFNASTRTFSGIPTTNGTYTVTYKATDSKGAAVSATFTITVIAQQVPPIYNGGYTNQTGVIGGGSINIPVPSGAFVSPGGQTLTYSAMVLIPQHNLDYYVNGTTDIATRTVAAQWVSISQVGLAINSSTGAISGSPTTLNYLVSSATNTYEKDSAYQLEVIATNPYGNVAAQFTLTNSFAPPAQVNAIGNLTANPGQGGINEISSNTFSDPYGGGLTYSAKLTSGAALPAGITWGGTAVYVGAAASGSYGIQVIATDKLGRTATATFTLTVNNAAPVFAGSLANQTAVSGSAMAAYTAPYATDANGDAITYSATGLPAGISFNASTRTFSGTPTSTGTFTITYKATDIRGAAVSATFTITVSAPVNKPPVYNGGINGISFDAGASNSWTVPAGAFTNPTGRALTYLIARQDGTAFSTNYSWNSTTGTLTATLPSAKADRDFYVIITAKDAVDGMSVSTTTDLYITADQISTNLVSTSGNKGRGQGAGGSVKKQSATVSATTLAVAAPVPNTQAYWFTYDDDNRVAVSNGQLVNGQIVVSNTDAHSYSQSYDAAGNVVTVVKYGTGGVTSQRQDYDERNELLRTWWPVTSGGVQGIEETRRYDDNGRLTTSDIYFRPGSTGSFTTADGTFTLDLSGWMSRATVNTYDADGRMASSSDYARPSTGDWVQTAGQRINAGLLTVEQEMDPGTSGYGLLQLNSQVLYSDANNVSGYDAAGNLKVYRYTALDSSTQTWTTNTYTTSYYLKDSYLEKATVGTSTDGNAVSSTVTGIYDNFGQRLDLVTHYNNTAYSDQVRAFAYDGNGQILERRDGTISGGSYAATGGTGTHHYAYANSQQVAEVDEGGNINALGGLTAFSNSDTGTQNYTVQIGDTLASIAQQVYGTSTLWYVVANANGLSQDSDLVVGNTLKLPEVTTSTNDATTFKPYNPAEISGSTTPSLPQAPPPPSSHHCSALAQIIVIAVVVVASIYTAGLAAEAFAGTAGATAGATFSAGASALSGGLAGTAAVGVAGSAVGAGVAVGGAWAAGAAAVGGFLGSSIGQLTGQSLGIQGAYSLKSALVGGLTAAAGSEIGGALGHSSSSLLVGKNGLTPYGVALQSASSYSASIVAATVTGQSPHFSWTGLLSTAVSAAVTNSWGLPTNNQLASGAGTGAFLRDLGGGLVNGALQSETSRLLGGDASNSGQIVRDAFGNALANAVVADAIGSNFNQVDPAKAHELQVEAAAEVNSRSVMKDVDGARTLDDVTLSVPTSQGVAVDGVSGNPATVTHYAGSYVDPYLVHANNGQVNWSYDVATYAASEDPLLTPTNLMPMSPVATAPVHSGVFDTLWGVARGLWDGGRKTTDAIGSFVGGEVWELTHEGVAYTRTAQLMARAGNFLDSEAATAITRGFQYTQTGQALDQAAAFANYLLNERSVSDDISGAKDFAAQVSGSVANYWNTHSGEQIGYDAGHLVGEQVPILVLTEGAGTAIEVGGDLAVSTASVVGAAASRVSGFVGDISDVRFVGSSSGYGSIAQQVGAVGDLSRVRFANTDAVDLGRVVDGIAEVPSEAELPVYQVSRSKTPNIAANTEAAIAEGQPSVLTRLEGESQISANRRAALRGQSAPDSTQSLDEYPFASSQQGGAGARVMAVPRGEQSIQGGTLSRFYQNYNINHGDPFLVQIVE